MIKFLAKNPLKEIVILDFLHLFYYYIGTCFSMITLIIPCLNEKSNINLIIKNIKLFSKKKHLIVDGGSNDNSKELYKKNKINFITTFPSRGLQQKKGAEKSNTEWLFFLHADTELNIKNILLRCEFLLTRSDYEN